MEFSNDEWIHPKLGEALVHLAKTGSKKDVRRSIDTLPILHEMHPAQARAGRPSGPISMGEPKVCIDYSSQTVSVGAMSLAIIDFAENLAIGGKCVLGYLNGRKLIVTSALSCASHRHTNGYFRGVPEDPVVVTTTDGRCATP